MECFVSEDNISTQTRVCTLHLKNSVLEDGDWWAPEISKSLREYADMIDEGLASWKAVEFFKSKKGTEVSITTGTYFGEKLPRKESDRRFSE